MLSTSDRWIYRLFKVCLEFGWGVFEELHCNKNYDDSASWWEIQARFQIHWNTAASEWWKKKSFC